MADMSKVNVNSTDYDLKDQKSRDALVDVVDNGAKNTADMSKSSFTTLTKDSVTVTLSGDTITASGTGGTSTNNFFNIYFQTNTLLIPAGTWVISLAGTGIDKFRVEEYDNAHSDVVKGDFGQPLIATVPDNATLSYIRITSKPSTNCAGNFKLMITTPAAWDVSHKYVPYRLPYQEISDTVQVLKKVHHYGFIIDKNNSDSYTAVSYTHGAVGFSPAYMDYTNNKFVYGSWADAWFIRDAVPVALNFDGTEAFELDKSDFTKKADGTASGIDCITMVLTDFRPSDWTTNWKWYYTKSGDYYVAVTASSAPTWAENTYYKAVSALDVNFMLRMPKVYFKRADDVDHNYIEIADKQIDQDFHAYAHIDANGVEKDYIYLPLFKGSMINGKLRSVPNVWPKNFTTAQNEIDAAAALGTGWQIWDHSSRELINDLLILISKSLDSQTTFGRGRESGYVNDTNQNYGLLKTGSLMDKGMFYGYSSSTAEVKVFGMESFWANRWDRTLGLILNDNVWKIKMTPPYNLTADGYVTPSGDSTPSANGQLKSFHSSEYGSVPAVGGGEASKYYRDYFNKNNSGTRVALVGGRCDGGASDGFRCVAVNADASYSAWGLGASPVYK